MSNLYKVSTRQKMIRLLAKIHKSEQNNPTTKSLHADYLGNNTWSIFSFTKEGGLKDLTETEMKCFKGLCEKNGISHQG